MGFSLIIFRADTLHANTVHATAVLYVLVFVTFMYLLKQFNISQKFSSQFVLVF